jgi:hypothetical protein
VVVQLIQAFKIRTERRHIGHCRERSQLDGIVHPSVGDGERQRH